MIGGKVATSGGDGGYDGQATELSQEAMAESEVSVKSPLQVEISLQSDYN